MALNLPKIVTAIIFFFVSILIINTASTVYATEAHIVISEVEIGKANAPTDEFIELYNPTTQDANISGWHLARKTATGTESDLVSTISGTIKAHGYFLFTPQTGYTGSASADQTYDSEKNSISNDNTILLFGSDGATIIDKVGFGKAIDSETEPETNPAPDTSRERKANTTSSPTTMASGGSDELKGNGEDTDNNANDFILRNTPQPQNSLSTNEPLSIQTPTDTPIITLTDTPTPSSMIPTISITPTLSLAPSPTAFQFPQIPKFQTVCKTTIIPFHIGNMKFHIPTISCTLIKL
jgi:hypothetical protein